MRIRSPKDLHYPITVSELLKQPDDAVDRFAPLFAYTYQSTAVTESNKYGDEQIVKKLLPAEFQSETEGTLTAWAISVGDIIDRPGTVLLEIEEPCKHEIQFGGLCTNCGKDMTLTDYTTTQRNDQRATISVQPRQAALKVSEDEANKASELSKKRLLSTKKLSLVVDLDQTIIHATVDPTVAEWQKNEDNPNYNAVKDVRCFKLNDGGPVGRGCNYYIKLRPGLEEFLVEISKKYELHIYTMGTGPYAQNIADVIDPDHTIFGDRILSRDESGSLTLKTLHKLFPMDQRMVVIIDDRGDIWNWSANLIKVNPYDFFVGIGDINSSFLPKRQDIDAPPPTAALPPSPTVETKIEKLTVDTSAAPDQRMEEPPSSQGSISSIDQQLLAMVGSDNPAVLEEQAHQQEETIAAQLSDRPLLRQQEQLDKQDEEGERHEANGDTQHETPSESGSQRYRHNLLRDDDVELKYLRQNLEKLHRAFYDEYERKTTGSLGRIAELRGEKRARPADQTEQIPDITDLLTPLKAQVLKGVVILFTGVIPQGINHQSSDLGIWAQTFGATVNSSLSRSTTHVIAHKDRRTSKVRQAAKHPHIKIVTTQWLFDCFAQWEKVDEALHAIEVERDPHSLRDALPFEVLPDGLSSDDEGGAEDFSTDIDGDNYSPPSVDGDDSPIEMTDNQWSMINDELDEFLRSEGEEDEDSQSDTSMHSVHSNGTGTAPAGLKKRKRAAESADASETENDSDVSVGDRPSSKLEHRKKKARSRLSALNNSTTALSEKSSGLPSPDATGPEEESLKETAEVDDNEEDDGLEQAFLDELEREEGDALAVNE